MAKHGTLHHIEIYTKDLKSIRIFWEWLLEKLDYTVFQEWDSGVSFISGDSYIVFVQVEDRFYDLNYHRCGPGLNHLAFHVESREFIENIYLELKKRNINVLYQDRHPYAGGQNYYAIYFEDPQRMKVELVAQ